MKEGTGRRHVLGFVCGAISAGIAVAVGVPAGLFLGWPARRHREQTGFIDVGALEGLPEREPVRLAVRAALRDAFTRFPEVTLGAAWLRRDGGRVRALSAVCPHTGCSIDWSAARDRFECPCHGSVFAPDGARVSGPSPRGMDPLEVELIGGRLRVRWQRFRAGVATREPS